MADKQQRPRVLIVEDEMLVFMLVEDYLDQLGYDVVGPASSLEKALTIADEAEMDLAVLDVNLDGKQTFPVADRLVARGVPFIFATGYGAGGVPPRFSSTPVLQKPFKCEDLGAALREISAIRSA
ncbi:MAG: response regulator [Hyphomicrobiales bacterium]|nr:response regulator [Hyphomicrobiales bacterium]